MANKILRLHNSGDNTLVDWMDSAEINGDQLNEITDPDGARPEKEITSIPSPFARIDLTLTAFTEVVKLGLDGTTIFHKMVSDSLDIGEIFFNIRKYKEKFQILYWDKNANLQELLNSGDKEHIAVGETIKMFLEQDSSIYNFDKMDRIFLLNYIGPDRPTQMNIVGATSPCTLFFSSANDLSYISKHIAFGEDKPFDGIFCPLYKRDFEYIKYLWLFRANYPHFANDFRVIDAYLSATYTKLRTEQKDELDSLDAQKINEYDSINIADINNNVEILTKLFHQRPEKVVTDSDFEIQSTIYKGAVKPLVLPIECGTKYISLKYAHDNWTKDHKAPIYDERSLSDRTLPKIEDKHPYITIGDLLSDTLIRSPFNLNDSCYFGGNIESSQVSYLLPLTELFFDMFTVKELMGEVDNGKKMIEMRENVGGMTVTLRIPIKGNRQAKFIEYQRSYFTDYTPNPNENNGTITDKTFGLGVYPFSSLDNVNAHYRIPLFDKGPKDIDLSFFSGPAKVNLNQTDRVCRREKTPGVCSIETYVVGHHFDRIKVSLNSSVSGYVVPKLHKNIGASQFTFSVDFGTSNTHIEYSVDGTNDSLPLDISAKGQQMVRLHKSYLDNIDIDRGFLDNNTPEKIGDNEYYKFPLRTAFAEYNRINYDTAVYALASGNIAFRYEKANTPDYNKISTDLKWASDKKEQIRLFLSNIYMLIRNKVLLEGGNLAATKIIWFYPASMTEAHFNNFNSIWKELYQEYIGANGATQLVAISESVAPYSFYKKKRGDKPNIVSIDVGGGTTDVYIVEDYKPRMLSSFRFAANALFGDGYGFDSDNNGYVKIYSEEFKRTLESNKLRELVDALNSIESKKVSSDIIAFFFTLMKNQKVVDENIRSLDFLSKLTSNQQLKYCFIIFYSAIIYYVALSMKAKGLQLPLTIAFSGNGSRTINILSGDNKTLQNYCKLIFEGVYGEKYSTTNTLEVVIEENPKVATCKGGILAQGNEDFEAIDNLKCSLLGIDKTTLSTDDKLIAFDDVDLHKKVLAEVEDFIEFIFNLNRNNKNLFSAKFDADLTILNAVHKACKENLEVYIKSGLVLYKEEFEKWGGNVNGSNINISETLFFLPIIGMLNNIANKIANQSL